MRSRFTPSLDLGEINRRFYEAVNMTASQLRAWLRTSESRSVGYVPPGGRVSVGRRSARRIVRILEQGGPASASDYAHARRVAGYVARHLAQRPAGDVQRTRWRYSLMNWGHDPL